ncbi:MAG: hypothetical protein Q9163_004791, partial [Psora crenata]
MVGTSFAETRPPAHVLKGPIVRISPYELHINDPDFYDEVYVGASVRRTERYPWAMRFFGGANSTFKTIDHDLHRARRAVLAPFFSNASVQRLEPSVQQVADKLLARLQDLKGTGTKVNLINMFSAFSGDVIWQYAFAKSYLFVEQPDFAPHWYRWLIDIGDGGHLMEHFPWLEPLVTSMPLWLTKLMSPRMMPLINLQTLFTEQVNETKSDVYQGKDTGKPTIIHDMLLNDQVRPQDKETAHLVSEGTAIIGAGTLTTAHTLSLLLFHLLDNPDILAKVRRDLKALMPDADAKPKWHQLNKLPYLNAVVTEGLRFSSGTSHRLQRVSPDVALQYQSWTIPPGTPVGMTSMLIHNNPTVFQDPQ